MTRREPYFHYGAHSGVLCGLDGYISETSVTGLVTCPQCLRMMYPPYKGLS